MNTSIVGLLLGVMLRLIGVGFGLMLPIGKRKEKMRKVFECFRCGFAWHSPWWEPTFVGRRMAIKEHEVMHDVALANALSWQSGGAQAERERIIKLLEEHAGIGEDCLEHRDLCNCTFNGRAIDIIALIKGENK